MYKKTNNTQKRRKTNNYKKRTTNKKYDTPIKDNDNNDKIVRNYEVVNTTLLLSKHTFYLLRAFQFLRHSYPSFQP